MLRNRLSAWLRPVLTLAALAGVLSLAACGGGGGAPNNPYQPGAGPLTVTPATGTGYSGNPFTFSITGGTAPYTVISSDPVVLPVPGTVGGNSLTVVPGTVSAATAVTFTVSDSAGHQATGALTVNPAFLLPASITITGNPNCAASGATLCSGQDGTATVKVTGPTGAGLAGRQVRFDVIQGDFTISPPGQPSVLTLTVTTDQNGSATVRLLVSVSAATQIASIRATDVTSGSNVLGQFTIAQYVNGDSVLSVIPSGTTTFTGPDTATCNAGGRATFYIFGGTPPYTVQTNFPQAISISGAPVTRSGGGFTITTTGLCFTNLTFAITDATGRVLLNSPTVNNVVGTAAAAPTPIVLTPSAFPTTGTIACTASSTVTQIIATGGTGTYTNAASPAPTNITGAGPLIVNGSGSPINVSVGAANAHGDWDINVSSGSSIATAVIHCSP